ncbi:MAG TPA: sigma-70 family RNA polymerase sigma factor [Candidatus Coprovivens excrementavium]|nr:sigma-70 family RNA polymerase sigma factor [Candidatus Coprovivens excrementavium]
MYNKKVSIPGINTNDLKTLTNDEMIKLFKAYHQGDQTAKDKLVEGNLKLVLSILKRFKTTEENINDMFQIGCIGLIKAIDNFNLTLNVCFSTYAVFLIKGEILRAFRDATPIRVSRGTKDIAYKILSYKEKYYNNYGIEPSNSEIAKALGIEEYFISYALTSLKEPLSIYQPIYNDGGDTIYLLDQIADHKDEYDKETLISLRKALKNLKERERNIIYNRYIIGKTQTELSQELNISQAQVSRIEKTALENIKRLVK